MLHVHIISLTYNCAGRKTCSGNLYWTNSLARNHQATSMMTNQPNSLLFFLQAHLHKLHKSKLASHRPLLKLHEFLMFNRGDWTCSNWVFSKEVVVWLQVWCWAAPGFTINNPSWVITTLHISNKPSASFGHVRHIFSCTLQGWLPQQTRLSAVLERYWAISLAQHHTFRAGPKREVHYRASRAQQSWDFGAFSIIQLQCPQNNSCITCLPCWSSSYKHFGMPACIVAIHWAHNKTSGLECH